MFLLYYKSYLLGFLVLVLAFSAGVRLQYQSLTRLQEETEAVQRQSDVILQLQKDRARLQESMQMDNTPVNPQRLQFWSNSPIIHNVQNRIVSFSSIAEAEGLNVLSFSPLATDMKGHFQVHNIQFQVQGSTSQLLRWIYSMEQSNPDMRASFLQMKKEGNSSPNLIAHFQYLIIPRQELL